MTRIALILTILASLTLAGAATAATYNGHRVTARLVGGIDASPCTSHYGCAKGVVELRYNGHSGTHLVRCPMPKRLHVEGVVRNRRGVFADVFACSRHYVWRLP